MGNNAVALHRKPPNNKKIQRTRKFTPLILTLGCSKRNEIMRQVLLFFGFLIISGCAGPALHGIGIYEGSYPSGVRHSFGFHPDGHVEVKIHDTDQPLVIVLSSYEPVVWKLVPDIGVEIKEIIISGYHPSKVVGLNSIIKVSRQPFEHPYKSMSSNSKFAIKVFEYTGINEFKSYQGAYNGAIFSIH